MLAIKLRFDSRIVLAVLCFYLQFQDPSYNAWPQIRRMVIPLGQSLLAHHDQDCLQGAEVSNSEPFANTPRPNRDDRGLTSTSPQGSTIHPTYWAFNRQI